MALEGPQLHYARTDIVEEDMLGRALRLAREIEELLEVAPSLRPALGSDAGREAQSIRIARAMAASLVDELEGVSRGARKSGIA